MKWWSQQSFNHKRPYLEKRMNMIRSIRRYFDQEEFYEVETPALQVSPGMEPHLHAFKTEQLTPEKDKTQELYLHTSPEFAMKKLLVAGLEKIYQICHVYRNAEGSSLHNAEFTMIEWYRAHEDYTKLMDDCIHLFRLICKESNTEHFLYNGITSNPFKEWEKISVIDAYKKYASLDLPPDTSPEKWEDLFYTVFLNEVEPQLGSPVPTILYDYPISMAALSRAKPEDPRFAERFEVYISGIEIANAFSELTDHNIQLQRFKDDMALKRELYGEEFPIDYDFIEALETGLPDSAGIALGIDRLAMVLCGVEDIHAILWTA
jgi:lysyl-tRNA synthetase class 2